MKKIIEVYYNWFSWCDGSDAGDAGNDWERARIGEEHKDTKLIVKEIKEHLPQGEGDRLYYDILFEDDTELRIFNPNNVLRK